MLDARLFRSELENTAAQLARRGFVLDVAAIAKLESERKEIQVKTQELQAERNARSKAIGQAKAKGEDAQPLLDAVADLGDRLKAAESRLNEIQDELNTLVMRVPNIPHASVPEGKDENDGNEPPTEKEECDT